ncbi:MAG TPA: hypothetical protein VLC08_10000 [Chitinolyticbacter sp.]|nr:hypothetical protein [Chitinolyticbacter sp.]
MLFNLTALQRAWADWIAAALSAALLLLAWISWSNTGWYWGCGLTTLFGIAGWHTQRARYLAIYNTPLTRVASTSQGYVRLAGIARASDGVPLASPFGTSCVWYHCIEEERQGGPGNNRGWTKLSDVTSSDTFALDDGSGRCLVDPDGADLRVGDASITYYGEVRRTEWWIFPGQRIEVLGDFATLLHDSSLRNQRERVSGRLAEWKHDRDGLLHRFDVDGNGEIDQAEWDAVRRAAEREVMKETVSAPRETGTHLVRKPARRAPFYIVTGELDALARYHQRWSWAYFALAVLALHGLWWLGHSPDFVELQLQPPLYIRFFGD